MDQDAHARRAIITGITGQDGSYLAELLLAKGYRVHGVLRNKQRLGNIGHVASQLHLHSVDLLDLEQVTDLITRVGPAEYYHLASPTTVSHSLQRPFDALRDIAVSVMTVLEAIRRVAAPVRFMQAGSSEMFGQVDTYPQDECTPLRPQNPYASAKVFAHHIVKDFREHHGVFACNAMLFNHESPRRGMAFVTRKITSSVARIKLGLQDKLMLGSLTAARDWGYAGDFVRAYWSMLQQPRPQDFVLGTGQLHTVEDFAKLAFEHVNLNWQDYVEVDSTFVGRQERVPLVANIARARQHLQWEPTTTLAALVARMVDHDLDSLAAASAEHKAA